MNSGFKLSCVLFDLDGTLVDTAQDLIACLNYALVRHGFNAVAGDAIKPFISYGAAAMIEAGLGHSVGDERRQTILTTMLDHYQCHIAVHSVLFSGIPETLSAIETKGLKWGVVTNKRERFTRPLMDALKLTERAACVISGDTTDKSKPDPEPMLAGCRQADVAPEECVYIGDARHDISAGKNAGMKTLAAVYGYLKPDDMPANWDADGYIEHPEQIRSWLTTTLCH